MRLTEFHERVTLRFGAAYGASVLVDHVLTGFGVVPRPRRSRTVSNPATCGGRCVPISTSPATSGEFLGFESAFSAPEWA
ncbi:hypothetical protein BZL30_0320 [Mycobacterium kansasii]|uniref:Uncharacterized protein n=1 Tax=Mycobacterium kansasii TaxID=1768 RepID=A0A1V3XSM6_MYCKA|nr:hypothetical protein BZL30_0320 [Mycobacterium kansasii]